MKNKFKIMMNFILIMSMAMCSISYAAAGAISSAGQTILSAILWVGYAVALGMVVMIGIKYMLGAADVKANMKSAITNWLIGAFLVFGFTTVIGIVTGIIGGTNTPSEIINAAGGASASDSASTPDHGRGTGGYTQ